MQVLFLSTEVFCTPVLFGCLAHSTKFCWALSDQKGMSYLAKKKSLMKRAYRTQIINPTKKCKAALRASLQASIVST
jgi:hypothetical protein